MIKRVVVVAWALVMPLIGTGCGSATTAQAPARTRTAPTTVVAITPSSVTGSGSRAVTPTTTGPGLTPPTRAGAAGSVQLTEKDDGTTIRVAKGKTIVVVLNSTYWRFPDATTPAVLRLVGSPSVVPAPPHTCVPGGGCGIASATYKAVGTGQTHITAWRTTCGEAMLCAGTAGSYSVEVVVTAS